MFLELFQKRTRLGTWKKEGGYIVLLFYYDTAFWKDD